MLSTTPLSAMANARSSIVGDWVISERVTALNSPPIEFGQCSAEERCHHRIILCLPGGSIQYS
jgi:hypothetical protein